VITGDEDRAGRGIHQCDHVLVSGDQRRVATRRRITARSGRLAKPGVQHQGLQHRIHVVFAQPVPLGDGRPKENAPVLHEVRI